MMSTKQALAKMGEGLMKASAGQRHNIENEFDAGMVALYEVREWLEDFVERVGDVKLGG